MSAKPRAWTEHTLSKKTAYHRPPVYREHTGSKRRRSKRNRLLQLHYLSLSGLHKEDDFKIYSRSEVIEMWHELDVNNSWLNVVGAPGTGKSMVAWAWACHNSLSGTASSRKILWVHLNKSRNMIQLCYLVKSKIHTSQHGSNQFHDAIHMMADAEVLIMDGVTKTEYNSFSASATSWMCEKENRKVVAASVVIAKQHLELGDVKEWQMSSWTWKDYVDACNYSEFYKQIVKFLPLTDTTKEDKLAQKFFMAGSSAR